MAGHPSNWPMAHTAEEANQMALKAAAAAIEALVEPSQKDVKQWMAAKLLTISANTNLYINCQAKPKVASRSSAGGPVVQVDTFFKYSNKDKNPYTVHVMLDVDKPLQPGEPGYVAPKGGNTQQPHHFGWEVYIKKGRPSAVGAKGPGEQRLANGHVALPANILTAGRTPWGEGLSEYSYDISGDNEPAKVKQPADFQVSCTFKRYK